MNDPIQEITRINQERQADAIALAKHNDLLNSNTQVQETIVKSASLLVDFLSQHVSKTQVVNQLTEIGTPDALRVVEAVNDLHETLRTHENTDLSEITEVMQGVLDEVKAIPKESIVIPEQEKDIDYSDRFTSLEEAVKAVSEADKAHKTTVEAPVVNVPETSVNVEAPDLKPLSKDLQAIKKAIKDTVYPTFDSSKLEKELTKQTKLLDKILDKPVGGGGGGGGSSFVAVNGDGIPQPLNINADGELMTTSAGGGGTTDAIQNVEMINALRALLQQIAVPSWFDPTTNTLRVGTTAVTVSSGTVTTVGAVTNLTNFGTNPADVMARDISINTWANAVRSTIS